MQLQTTSTESTNFLTNTLV